MHDDIAVPTVTYVAQNRTTRPINLQFSVWFETSPVKRATVAPSLFAIASHGAPWVTLGQTRESVRYRRSSRHAQRARGRTSFTWPPRMARAAGKPGARPRFYRVPELATHITGDGSAASRNSAFIVDKHSLHLASRTPWRIPGSPPEPLTRRSRRQQTVMPAKVDLHGALRLPSTPRTETMAKEILHAREPDRPSPAPRLLRDSAPPSGIRRAWSTTLRPARLARTRWGDDAAARAAARSIPGAALFRTAQVRASPGPIPGACKATPPGRVLQLIRSPRSAGAIEAVRDNARMKPEFIKIWVDEEAERRRS